MNSIPLRSIVAVNKSPKAWAGSLREIHISITGKPNDYAVEVASGAWFGSLFGQVLWDSWLVALSVLLQGQQLEG